MIRPRFGALTRVLGAVFLISGVGAVRAAVASGEQATPGHEADDLVLLGLSVIFLAVAVGLWLNRLWAWWVGAAVTLFTVVADAATRSPDRGWRIWLLFLAMFVTSAVQGRS